MQEQGIADRVGELEKSLDAERAPDEGLSDSADDEDGPNKDVEPVDDVVENASTGMLGGILRSLINRDEVDARLVATRFEEINESLSWLEPGLGEKANIRHTCVGCEEQFSEENNRKGACSHYRWHPSESHVCLLMAARLTSARRSRARSGQESRLGRV